MSKIVLAIITAAVFITALVATVYYRNGKLPTAPQVNKEVINDVDKLSALSLPLNKALLRVTKKPFGIYISPKNSPVAPEKFTGYHTGADFEIFPGEENKDVSVLAICDGKLLVKKFGRGYGGMAVESCNINSQPVTVVYGHLKLTSIIPKVGDKLAAGSVLGIFGNGYTIETDYERKHLHLGIHKGSGIDTRGYVATKSELNNWIDPLLTLK